MTLNCIFLQIWIYNFIFFKLITIMIDFFRKILYLKINSHVLSMNTWNFQNLTQRMAQQFGQKLELDFSKWDIDYKNHFQKIIKINNILWWNCEQGNRFKVRHRNYGTWIRSWCIQRENFDLQICKKQPSDKEKHHTSRQFEIWLWGNI